MCTRGHAPAATQKPRRGGRTTSVVRIVGKPEVIQKWGYGEFALGPMVTSGLQTPPLNCYGVICKARRPVCQWLDYGRRYAWPCSGLAPRSWSAASHGLLVAGHTETYPHNMGPSCFRENLQVDRRQDSDTPRLRLRNRRAACPQAWSRKWATFVRETRADHSHAPSWTQRPRGQSCRSQGSKRVWDNRRIQPAYVCPTQTSYPARPESKVAGYPSDCSRRHPRKPSRVFQ